jgi:anti-sigma factor RsiW
MPHISEGDLHAWLDGAIPEDSEELRAIRVHLKSCPDCAAQLEDARRLRSEADAILASTLPAGAGPAFEEIRLRSLQEDPASSPAHCARGG